MGKINLDTILSFVFAALLIPLVGTGLIAIWSVFLSLIVSFF